MDAVRIEAALERYRARVRQFDAIAARRTPSLVTQEIWPELRQPPSRRETDVLKLIAQGLSNKEIGVELFVAEDTVKTHVRNLLVKLKAKNRAHAVAIGIAQGVIHADVPPRATEISRAA
jgi:ATP/maltotriose-dependent transcriptional regulator MalT